MLSQLNLTVWAWIEAVRDLRRVRVLQPFLVLAAVQLVVLLLLTQFYRPGLSALMVPMLSRVQDGAALHYPQFYIFLPGIFSQANLVIDWLFGSLVFGTAFLTVWYVAFGRQEEGSWRRARKRYLGLLLVRLPLILLLVGAATIIPEMLAGDGGLAGTRLRMVRYGSFFVGAFVEMLFVFAPLILLAESRSVGQALRKGLMLAAKVPLATALIVLVPNLVQIPTGWVFRRADSVVRNLSPELVAVLVGASVIVYVFVNYFIVASAVRVYASRAERPGGALA